MKGALAGGTLLFAALAVLLAIHRGLPPMEALFIVAVATAIYAAATGTIVLVISVATR